MKRNHNNNDSLTSSSSSASSFLHQQQQQHHSKLPVKDEKKLILKKSPVNSQILTPTIINHSSVSGIQKNQNHRQRSVSKGRTVLHPMKNELSNAELLEKLGLSKLQVPPAHNRKRLAVESRHHSRPDDSHMFVIKLPPNPYYYGNLKPSVNNKNSIDDKSRKIPVGFKSNGKPGRIYHWNIPVLKKIINSNQSRRNPNLRNAVDYEDDLIDIKHIPTWSKPWENEAMDKNSLKHTGLNGISDKMIKKKSPTYYAPTKPKQTNFKKYFSGNGKPKSFYVIDNKHHKPIQYHKLIS
uniref:CSON006180 protein n=1 Tax=Culicoides sonorensis TaxID=179676 RepID=A0A336M7X7_CULSO